MSTIDLASWLGSLGRLGRIYQCRFWPNRQPIGDEGYSAHPLQARVTYRAPIFARLAPHRGKLDSLKSRPTIRALNVAFSHTRNMRREPRLCQPLRLPQSN